ncbi:ubiquitin-like protein ATG12 [Dinothrombium tinctorium]|uniref:Ubiquitin-like protein ATG12 n=1 Tax=Dinothrombium tinctorium TaxID=1965070 RepID=A0A3S3PHS5_9ACAR|nr:ubiquitin-like protein ATG12 [Dinothrombium tinctorium]RWS12730.1 ubiquitin-like protein ATG12 [Dinothrombium tinctorium]RWS13307.1 ubiquitin-like protein ATG12 [Dinothrombium tinctorium]
MATEAANDAIAERNETDGVVKVDVLLKATGDVPIMKKKKWLIDANKTVLSVITFIKQYLKLDANEPLFLYVSQSFCPSPDHRIRNLYDCFAVDGRLIFYYSKTPAWG